MPCQPNVPASTTLVVGLVEIFHNAVISPTEVRQLVLGTMQHSRPISSLPLYLSSKAFAWTYTIYCTMLCSYPAERKIPFNVKITRANKVRNRLMSSDSFALAVYNKLIYCRLLILASMFFRAVCLTNLFCILAVNNNTILPSIIY